MAPFYQLYDDVIELQPDDQAGLQHLYGAPVIHTSPPREAGNKRREQEEHLFIEDPQSNHVDRQQAAAITTTTPPPVMKPANICSDPQLDAITVIGNGTTYAFKVSDYDGYSRH